jgi:hypothetical protein
MFKSQQKGGGMVSDAKLRLPFWQTVVILAGFPFLYFLNSFTPWSQNLWHAGNRAWYLPFWSSILLLHWISFACALSFVRKAGGSARSIGLKLSFSGITGASVAYAFIGLVALIWFAIFKRSPVLPANPEYLLIPRTFPEGMIWIAAALTAGVCEETVYRGFGITALEGYRLPTGIAVVITSLSFIFIHGTPSVAKCLFNGITGILFCILFIMRRNIFPNIVIHTALDFTRFFT